MTFTLSPHQNVMLAYYQANESFANFSDPGTGKTLPTLVHVCNLLKRGHVRNALIVSPNRVQGAWLRDMEKFNLADQLLLEEGVTVINYEKLYAKIGKPIRDTIWDCIILDEAHRIKNRTTRTAKACHRLSMKATYRYILTGTPISNGQLHNYWSMWAFLFPAVNRGHHYCALPSIGKWSAFVNHFCRLDFWGNPYAYRNVDELQDIITEHSYRITLEECLTLPETVDEIWDIESTNKSIYKTLIKEGALVEYDLVAENPLALGNYLRQISSGFLMLPDKTIELKSNKTKELSEWLEDFDGKAVIFYQFKYSGQIIRDLLDTKKLSYIRIDGDSKDMTIWRKFQTGDIRFAVCQYQAASEGIDLYAANVTIFYEPTQSSNQLIQAQARTHRRGQKKPCLFIHMLTKGTIEKRMYSALLKHQEINEKFFTEYINTYQKGGGQRSQMLQKT